MDLHQSSYKVSQRNMSSHKHHEGHDKHSGHNIADFWKRLIVCSVITIPVNALSPMIQM